jgi:signal transduction histidine kinase
MCEIFGNFAWALIPGDRVPVQPEPQEPVMTGEHLKLFVSTIQQLSLARDLDAIIEIVQRSARKLTGAEGVTFVLKDKDQCFYANEDAIAPLWKGQRFPLEHCVSGWAMINRDHVVIRNIYADPRVPAEAYTPTFVKSLVIVPIRLMDPVGAIGNYWAHEHESTSEEVELLQALADITSVSMENIYVYHELEERVKQRTTQLEYLNRELEAFSYSVSHDLQSPLRSINSLIRMVTENAVGKLADEELKMLQAASKSAVRMSHLVEDLLTFSKLDKKEISKTLVDMDALTSSVIHDIRRDFKTNTTILVHPLHKVEADYSLMQQVMYNLISNAVKYSAKTEHPRVEIASTRQGDEVIFTVRDNGVGFNMKYANKLFVPFQRLHTKSEFEGSGIGLANVSRIINRHGGKIWAEGKLNEGATFYFSLKNGLH